MGNKSLKAHVFISGRVQGVFYRAWIRNKASSLGLTGWVRNLSDGRVEAVFEGKRGKVEEMIRKCRKGSEIANISHIDVNWEKSTGEFEGFEILPTP